VSGEIAGGRCGDASADVAESLSRAGLAPGRLVGVPPQLNVVQLYRLVEIAAGSHCGASVYAMLLLARELQPPAALVAWR
jgi:hypothetical protein